MPIRTMKPETFDDEKVDDMSHAGFRLFWFLVSRADNYGVAPAHHRQLRRAFGRQKTPTECYLSELLSLGMIAVYEVDGVRYAWLRNFSKHQPIPEDRMGKPKHPPLSRATRVAAATERTRDVRKLRLVWRDVTAEKQLDLGLPKPASKRESGARRDREGIAKGSRRDRDGIEMGSRRDLDVTDSVENKGYGDSFQESVPVDQGSGIRDQGERDAHSPTNVVELRPSRLLDRAWTPPTAWLASLEEALRRVPDIEPPSPATVERFVGRQLPTLIAWHRDKGVRPTEEAWVLWMLRDWRGNDGAAFRRSLTPDGAAPAPDDAERCRIEHKLAAEQAKIDAELGITTDGASEA